MGLEDNLETAEEAVHFTIKFTDTQPPKFILVAQMKLPSDPGLPVMPGSEPTKSIRMTREAAQALHDCLGKHLAR